MRSLVLQIWNSSRQKLLMNTRSWSETKLRGKPWNLQTISMKSKATLSVVYVDGKAPKWAPLVKRLTTMSMVEKPCDVGSPVVKSSERPSQITTGRGWSKPTGFLVLYFVCGHMRHYETNLCTSHLLVVQRICPVGGRGFLRHPDGCPMV